MITVEVDATRAFARFGEGGIPLEVRNNLRKILPDLTKKFAGIVSGKLDTQLKSRRSLKVKDEIFDTTKNEIYGKVSVVASMGTITPNFLVNAMAAKEMLPRWLESGTKSHEIRARNVNYLHWTVAGGVAGAAAGSRSSGVSDRFAKVVHHPGFKGIHYMQTTFDDFKAGFIEAISKAAKEGAKK